MEDAIASYVAYRRTADAWMLGSFICPGSRLHELEPYTDLFTADDPVPFSILGATVDSAEAFLSSFNGLAGELERFHEVHQGRVVTDLLEIYLPVSTLENSGLDELLARLEQALAQLPIRFDRVHLELSFAGDWKRTIREALSAIARAPAGLPVLGAKLRCGGVTPDAFPTPEQVAFFIAACRDASVPLKATAGLHHPVRHFDRKLEVMQHGFLNVFGAAALASAMDLTEQALRQVLRTESVSAFSFDDDGFAFQDLRITTDQVLRARERFALSYGSCSFDEPREDLRAAGLLK